MIVVKEAVPVQQTLLIPNLKQKVEPAATNDSQDIRSRFTGMDEHGDVAVCPSRLWFSLLSLIPKIGVDVNTSIYIFLKVHLPWI